VRWLCPCTLDRHQRDKARWCFVSNEIGCPRTGVCTVEGDPITMASMKLQSVVCLSAALNKPNSSERFKTNTEAGDSGLCALDLNRPAQHSGRPSHLSGCTFTCFARTPGRTPFTPSGRLFSDPPVRHHHVPSSGHEQEHPRQHSPALTSAQTKRASSRHFLRGTINVTYCKGKGMPYPNVICGTRRGVMPFRQ
jgi:hypothetical protein